MQGILRARGPRQRALGKNVVSAGQQRGERGCDGRRVARFSDGAARGCGRGSARRSHA